MAQYVVDVGSNIPQLKLAYMRWWNVIGVSSKASHPLRNSNSFLLHMHIPPIKALPLSFSLSFWTNTNFTSSPCSTFRFWRRHFLFSFFWFLYVSKERFGQFWLAEDDWPKRVCAYMCIDLTIYGLPHAYNIWKCNSVMTWSSQKLLPIDTYL